MIKVIMKKQGIVFGSKQFDTQEQADAWCDESLPPSLGKPERWVVDDPANEDNEANKAAALETRVVEIMPAVQESVDEETGEIIPGRAAITRKDYKLAAEFTIEMEDVTAQLQQEQLVQEGRKRQQLGAEVIAKVYSINESKNISPQTFAAMLADSNLERIERMLWTGSLRTAKLMIQALDNTYFSSPEKEAILAMLSEY